MRFWAPVLHFYQPPTQEPNITYEVYKTSYKPFLDLLLKHPEIKLTINITGSLIVQLDQLGIKEFFEKINTLAERKQIEFVNSALYHPLLPLIDASVIVRQLHYNRNIIQHYLKTDTINGVFPPELGINPASLDTIAHEYEFCLVDESSVKKDFSHQYILKQSFYQYNDLTLIASSRAITEILRAYPREIKGEEFIQFLLANSDDNQIMASVNDVELFGHHYAHRFELLETVFKSEAIRLCQVSELLDMGKKTASTIETVRPSTWVTTRDDFEKNDYFPLWNKPGNELQQGYLKLMKTAYEQLSTTPEPQDDRKIAYQSAINHFDVGVSSCHLYWLSNWPWWHPDLVEKGAQNLIRSIRSLPVSREIKIAAEEQFSKLILAIWKYHWEGSQFNGYAAFDKYREGFLKTLPELESIT